MPAVPLAIPNRQPIKQHHRQLPHRQVLQQLSKQTLRVIYATTTVTSIKRYLTLTLTLTLTPTLTLTLTLKLETKLPNTPHRTTKHTTLKP